MATYSQSRYAGPPTGYYGVGDVVTDMNGVKWVCVASGYPSTFAPQPNIPLLEQDLPEAADFVGIAADLDGYANDATGATVTLAVNEPGDGLAHPVVVTYAGSEDLSLITLTLTGTDASDAALVEPIALTDG